MVHAPLLSDELLTTTVTAQSRHPMDSSRLLLGLMKLARKGEAARAAHDDSDPLAGIISRDLLKSLLSALHFRDVSTVCHSRRVAMLAVGMGRYLGWEGRQLKLLEVAALLHDVGKIGVPDNILFKPGKLSPDEAELMALHHNIGIDVLQACRVDQEVLEIVVQSHRHFHGADECFRPPTGTRHQGARILAVADAYDSLSHDQAYRRGMPHTDIMDILMDCAGTQFDGNVVSALSRWKQKEPDAAHGGDVEFSSGDGLPAPAHPQEALEASTLGHVFSYLYVLESLYDGFYLVDS
ncbi:MAG: HD-GYP domain-containing protein, partial [Planctomycetaceae bacterium]